jgi:hypothetical protein
MPANAGIHALRIQQKDVDGRDIGERSDAVLRTSMPGHDEFDYPPSVPLVDGTSPRARSSIAIAARSARAKPLKHDSAM